MDPKTQAVLTFLGAIQLAHERLSSLSYLDEQLLLLKPNGNRHPLTAWGITRFNTSSSSRQDTVGEILISASVDLRYTKAFYNNDRVESLVWHIELSWNESSFVISPCIIAYIDNRHQTETDLLTLPDRLASSVEECQRQLAQVTEELLSQRNIIYTLLGEAN